MPFIVTSLHDPTALDATCRRLNLPLPQHGSIQLGDQTVSGWIVRLTGTRHPIVCNTLNGLVAYHPLDNVHTRYAGIMRYIHRYYEVRAQLARRVHEPVYAKPVFRKLHRPCLVNA